MPETDSSPIAARRSRGGECWCIPDKGRDHFIGGFICGVLHDVKFTDRARPMTCVHGHDSEGEAVGVLGYSGEENPGEPESFKRKVKVFYSREGRFFHEEGNPEQKIESCDELHLHGDGAAYAFWLN